METGAIGTASPARQSGNWRMSGDKFERCPPAALCEFDLPLYTPNLNNL